MDAFNRYNAPLYKQIPFDDIDAFIIDTVSVSIIPEVRTGDNIQQRQNCECQRDPFSHCDILRKQPECIDRPDDRENDHASDDTGHVHAVERTL